MITWVFDPKWRIGQASLVFCNYSVPKADPIHNASSEKALREAIFRKIVRSHVILIPTGMYVNYSRWIKKEIKGARAMHKPILGIRPWGQQKNTSVVGEVAEKTVGWNSKSVVRGIWDIYYRR